MPAHVGLHHPPQHRACPAPPHTSSSSRSARCSETRHHHLRCHRHHLSNSSSRRQWACTTRQSNRCLQAHLSGRPCQAARRHILHRDKRPASYPSTISTGPHVRLPMHRCRLSQGRSSHTASSTGHRSPSSSTSSTTTSSSEEQRGGVHRIQQHRRSEGGEGALGSHGYNNVQSTHKADCKQTNRAGESSRERERE